MVHRTAQPCRTLPGPACFRELDAPLEDFIQLPAPEIPLHHSWEPSGISGPTPTDCLHIFTISKYIPKKIKQNQITIRITNHLNLNCIKKITLHQHHLSPSRTSSGALMAKRSCGIRPGDKGPKKNKKNMVVRDGHYLNII